MFLELAYILIKAYEFGIHISAIVYMQSMTRNRMQGSTRNNLKMLRALCGIDAYPCVWLTANECKKISPQQLQQRLEELEREPTFWKELYEGGATVFELDDLPRSADTLLDEILDVDKTYILQFQRQVVDEGREIHETSVGQAMSSEVSRTVNELKVELDHLRHELEEGRQQSRKTETEDLQKSIEYTEQSLDQQKKRAQALKSTTEELKTRWDAILAENRLQINDRLQELGNKIDERKQAIREEKAPPPPYEGLRRRRSLESLQQQRAELDEVRSMQLAEKNLKVAERSRDIALVSAIVGLGGFAIAAASCNVM